MGRPPERPMVEIELVEDLTSSGGQDAPGAGAGAAADPGRPTRDEPRPGRGWGPAARWGRVGARLASRRFTALVAGAALVVAIGVVVVVTRPAQAPGPTLLGATSADLSVPLREVWRVETRGAFSITAGLLMVSERVDRGMQVTAHGLRGGEARWSYTVPWDDATAVRCPHQVAGPGGPVVVCQALGGLVPTANPSVVAQDPGRLVLLDAATGAVLDERRLRGTHLAHATADGDLITVDRRDGAVEIRRTDGTSTTEVWTTLLPVEDSPRRSSVQVEVREGLLVVLGSAAAVIDATSGRVLGEWRPTATTFRASRAQVTVTAHGVAVRPAGARSDEPTRWYSLTGRELADVPGIVDEPLVGDGTAPEVVLTVRDGVLTTVDVMNGRARELGPADAEAPVLRRDGQVVLDGSGWVRGVDLVTGEERWRSRAAGLDQVSRVTDGRHVLVTGSAPEEGATLSAVSISDGSLTWKTALPPGGRALTWDGDTVVMVGTRAVIGLG